MRLARSGWYLCLFFTAALLCLLSKSVLLLAQPTDTSSVSSGSTSGGSSDGVSDRVGDEVYDEASASLSVSASASTVMAGSNTNAEDALVGDASTTSDLITDTDTSAIGSDSDSHQVEARQVEEELEVETTSEEFFGGDAHQEELVVIPEAHHAQHAHAPSSSDDSNDVLEEPAPTQDAVDIHIHTPSHTHTHTHTSVGMDGSAEPQLNAEDVPQPQQVKDDAHLPFTLEIPRMKDASHLQEPIKIYTKVQDLQMPPASSPSPSTTHTNNNDAHTHTPHAHTHTHTQHGDAYDEVYGDTEDEVAVEVEVDVEAVDTTSTSSVGRLLGALQESVRRLLRFLKSLFGFGGR